MASDVCTTEPTRLYALVLLLLLSIHTTLSAAAPIQNDILKQPSLDALDSGKLLPNDFEKLQMFSEDDSGFEKRLSPSSFSLARGKKDMVDEMEALPQRRLSPSQFMGMRGKRPTPPEGFMGFRGKRLESLLDDLEADAPRSSQRTKRQIPKGFVVIRGKRQPPAGFLGLRGKKSSLLDLYGIPDKKYSLPYGFQGARGKRFMGLGKKAVPLGFLGSRGKRPSPGDGLEAFSGPLDGFHGENWISQDSGHDSDESAYLEGLFHKRQLGAGFIPMRG